MTTSQFDLRRIEEAGLNALQTQRQLFYDGWVLRVSPGVAKRARSVNAHFGSTLPLEQKLEHCERLYQQQGLPVLFRITPFVAPSDLDAALAARGYHAFGETFVQATALDRPPDVPEHDDTIQIESPATSDFVEAVGEMRGSTQAQREAHRERLLISPLKKCHYIVRSDGRVVCAAQSAIDGGLAGVFDVVTAPHARRRGYATLACAALLSWAWGHGAQSAYLQVSASNEPAIRSYRRFGFETVYSYHYRGPTVEAD